MMNLLKFHPHSTLFHFPQTTPLRRPNFHLQFCLSSCSTSFHSLPPWKPCFRTLNVSKAEALLFDNEEEKEKIVTRVDDTSSESEYLAPDGVVYQKTLRLVECAMFAAVTGLVYFLSNSLSIENYFGCFFSLPIVITSMRWGVAAGRKTMVATAMLLFVLSGPVKALVYLLTHGLLGFTMGSLWRVGANWGLSIFLCTIARSVGAMGYLFTSSFLIRENILSLIAVNIHASLTLIFSATGLNIIPSMNLIYAIFGTLVLLNSGFFVFLLHLLYSIFLARLGMKASLRMPGWLEKAL